MREGKMGRKKHRKLNNEEGERNKFAELLEDQDGKQILQNGIFRICFALTESQYQKTNITLNSSHLYEWATIFITLLQLISVGVNRELTWDTKWINWLTKLS
eukprot:Sdes_comp23401_c0_seq1m21657